MLKAAPPHLRLLVGFGLVLALGAAQSTFAYRTVAENVGADAAQHHSEEVADKAGNTRTALLQMEAGYRGYLLTGDESLLVAYRSAALVLSADLAELQVIDANDQPALARWQLLERRVAVWQHDIIEPGIAIRLLSTAAGLTSAGLTSAALSQQDIGGIQRLLDGAIAVEQAALARSHAATIESSNRLKAVLLWGTLAALGVGLVVAGLFTRYLARAIAQMHTAEQQYRQMFSERMQSEETLRAAEEGFRKQYKGFPLPTCSWVQVDDDFVLQDYNDASAVNTRGAICDWIGSRASDRFGDYPEIMADLRACFREQRTLRRDTEYRNKYTGPERHLVFTYVFVPPQTIMVHTEDVTAARQADQQRAAMVQSEKLRALGQMATGIAHDLNQSLMLVASYSHLARQALSQSPPDLVELEDLLTTTTQAAMDGGETVKQLLLFTRAAPDQDGKPVDLSTLIREAAQLTAPRWRDAAEAEGRRISLQVHAEGHPTIQGSPAQLRELMTNLIFNAVDALPSGGTIHLRVAAEDGQGIVEVADSGMGMTEEVQARVFEPFFTTKGEGGTGLGLAMVFGIVDQHGGHIELHSAPGEGTTFRITFPLVAAALAVEPVARSLALLESPRPLRVLAVDDEPMMTKAVVRMLKPSGHLVSVAVSGEEALEKLAEQTFDVVVSDMGMGAGMNGWELADVVKRRWPNVRFLLATGWGAAMDPAEARDHGVEAVLSKPYHPVELLHVLARTDAAA